MTFRKKQDLVKQDTFTVSEPRFIKPKTPIVISKFTIFTPKEDEVYIDEQLSHAIYDIEIANSQARMGEKK